MEMSAFTGCTFCPGEVLNSELLECISPVCESFVHPDSGTVGYLSLAGVPGGSALILHCLNTHHIDVLQRCPIIL